MRGWLFLGAIGGMFLVYATVGMSDMGAALILACLLLAVVSAPKWFDRLVTGKGFWLAVVGLVLFVLLASSGALTTGYDNGKRANNWHWLNTGEGEYRR